MLSHISDLAAEEQGRPDDPHHRKKRVGRACNSCRIKKTKCDGIKPCTRCVQDNKICVFSEKKKSKDKSHPTGYVELLETRLDLLTKALEKVVIMAKPHLDFLDEFVSQDGDHEGIAINDVVSFFIHEKGLLRNLPVDWEKGAMIAANMRTKNKKDVKLASKSFADHKQKDKFETISEEAISEDKGDKIQQSTLNYPYSRSEHSTKNPSSDQEMNSTSDSRGYEEKDSDTQDVGLSSGNLLSPENEELRYRETVFELETSDQDSDFVQEQTSVGKPGLSVDTEIGNSEFARGSFQGNAANDRSVSSLVERFENQEFKSSPILGSTSNLVKKMANQMQPYTSRRPSQSRRTSSSSLSKTQNGGHISKPNHHSHSSSSAIGDYVINSGNDLDFTGAFSSPSSSFPLTPFSGETLLDEFTSPVSLPSVAMNSFEASKIRDVDIIDTGNFDMSALSNPYVSYGDEKLT